MSAVITLLILKKSRVINYQTDLLLMFKISVQANSKFILTLLHAY